MDRNERGSRERSSEEEDLEEGRRAVVRRLTEEGGREPEEKNGEGDREVVRRRMERMEGERW